MLKIGDFSRLAHVTVKTLRHYARLGLLRPAWVDRFSGYRYYSLEQLARLNRILALKDLGFTLDQVRQILDSPLTAEDMRGMLRLKQGELQRKLSEEMGRLARVETRLTQIETEGGLPGCEVVLKPLPAVCLASLRCVIPEGEPLDSLRAEVRAWAQTAGLRLTGAWVTVFHDTEYTGRGSDVEVGAWVEGRPQPGSAWGRVSLRHVPAQEEAACAAASGAEALPLTYPALAAWMEANGYRASGPAREWFVQDSGVQVIEVQQPVERIRFRIIREMETQEDAMHYKLVEMPALTVVGLPYVGKNENQEITQLWGAFNQRSAEIRNQLPEAAYGVCILLADAPEGVFEYVAGFAVSVVEDLPAGMVVRQIPALTYAAFTHRGALNTLHQTYEAIYQDWLPQSGYELAAQLDMEVYDERFKDFSPDSELDLYVPVKKKA